MARTPAHPDITNEKEVWSSDASKNDFVRRATVVHVADRHGNTYYAVELDATSPTSGDEWTLRSKPILNLRHRTMAAAGEPELAKAKALARRYLSMGVNTSVLFDPSEWRPVDRRPHEPPKRGRNTLFREADVLAALRALDASNSEWNADFTAEVARVLEESGLRNPDAIGSVQDPSLRRIIDALWPDGDYREWDADVNNEVGSALVELAGGRASNPLKNPHALDPDELDPGYGDPRRCRRHGIMISSADGMHDGVCGACEAEMDDEYVDERMGSDRSHNPLSRPLGAGSVVLFEPNPASMMLYGPESRAQLPAPGTYGVVTPISGRAFMPGPGGGLLYVAWDDGSRVGVSLHDATAAGSSANKHKRAAVILSKYMSGESVDRLLPAWSTGSRSTDRDALNALSTMLTADFQRHDYREGRVQRRHLAPKAGPHPLLRVVLDTANEDIGYHSQGELRAGRHDNPIEPLRGGGVSPELAGGNPAPVIRKGNPHDSIADEPCPAPTKMAVGPDIVWQKGTGHKVDEITASFPEGSAWIGSETGSRVGKVEGILKLTGTAIEFRSSTPAGAIQKVKKMLTAYRKGTPRDQISSLISK